MRRKNFSSVFVEPWFALPCSLPYWWPHWCILHLGWDSSSISNDQSKDIGEKLALFSGTSNNYAFARITESSTNDENDSTKEWVLSNLNHLKQPKTTSKKPKFRFQGSFASCNVYCFNNDIFRKFAFWFPGNISLFCSHYECVDLICW